MTDYMRYIHDQTVSFIKDSHADGPLILDEATKAGRVTFMFGIPNGWTGETQSRMRKCAVNAKFVPSEIDAETRINFILEGEASALSCLSDADAGNQFKVSSPLFALSNCSKWLATGWKSVRGR